MALMVTPETWSSPWFQASLKRLKLRKIDRGSFSTPASLFVKEGGGDFDPFNAVEFRALRAQQNTACAGPFTGAYPLTNRLLLGIVPAKLSEAKAMLAKLGLTLHPPQRYGGEVHHMASGKAGLGSHILSIAKTLKDSGYFWRAEVEQCVVLGQRFTRSTGAR
jgi:hypothetical protein